MPCSAIWPRSPPSARVGFALLGVAIALFSRRFGDHAMAAAGVAQHRRAPAPLAARLPPPLGRPACCGRRNGRCCVRDPWLVSQTLMQILYLLPPAVLLWVTFRDGAGAYVRADPGGGDGGRPARRRPRLAVDLRRRRARPGRHARRSRRGRVLRAKIEAVIGMIALVFAPMVVVLAFESPLAALVAALGVLTAAAAATLIQICFRTQAKRSQFRRRQTSSRIATFAEAFSSIAWAATAALAAGPSLVCAVSGADRARHPGRREDRSAPNLKHRPRDSAGAPPAGRPPED